MILAHIAPAPPKLRNIFTEIIPNVDQSKKSYLRNVQEGWIICSQMYFNYTYRVILGNWYFYCPITQYLKTCLFYYMENFVD